MPGSRPFFRKLIDATRNQHKFASIPITADIQQDLRSWSTLLKTWNRRERWISSAAQFTLEHDASKQGFGFLLTSTPAGFDLNSLPQHLQPGNTFAGEYSAAHQQEVEKSIQWGEMLAIAVSVAIYAPFLQNSTVLLKTDNIADVFIIRRQSTSNGPLLSLLRCIYATCARFNIDIAVEHVPGHLNSIPDYLSRPEKHKRRNHFQHERQSFNTHFINSSSFQPGAEAHLHAKFWWNHSSS
jgi:hypothetical protein